MSEQSTEVKGFKNSVLGKVLFKIAAVAGLQEALNGKAAINHPHNVSDITGMDTALKSKIQDGDNLIEISGDDTDGEIHINLMSEGDEGEGEDNDFYLGVDDLNNVFRPATTPAPGSSKLITSGAVFSALSTITSALDNKLDVIPLIELQQAADETNWEPNSSYDSIYTAACSWGKTGPVLVRFLKIDTFDVTLIGTLSANFNSADGTAVAVICAGGYKFVRRESSPASSIEELIWDNSGVTQTAISL